MTDRRSILTVAGLGLLAAGAGIGVTGCSPSSPGGPGSGSGSGSPASGNSVPTTDVPLGSGIVVGAFIVTQPTSGTFQAYSNVCPHQGCAVNKIRGAQIVCPCHQSTYSLADGSRISGPTPRGLTPAKATVNENTVTVTAS